MKASERLEIIIDEVQTNGIVRVAEISGRLGCSEVTIRNDIRKLDQQGFLRKHTGERSARKTDSRWNSFPENIS